MDLTRRKALLTGVGLGILGGLVGTILMDMVMMATFIVVGEPADTFFSMVGEKLGGGVIVGVAIHNVIGMTGGAVFAILVLSIQALRIESIRRGFMLGVGAGAITIPLGCIPLALWLGEPILEVVAFSIGPHLVWGAVLGWFMAYGLLRMKGSPHARPVR